MNERYFWSSKEKLPHRFGEPVRVFYFGSDDTCIVKFRDGEEIVAGINCVRRYDEQTILYWDSIVMILGDNLGSVCIVPSEQLPDDIVTPRFVSARNLVIGSDRGARSVELHAYCAEFLGETPEHTVKVWIGFDQAEKVWYVFETAYVNSEKVSTKSPQ